MWPHGCSGRRRARPPARLGDLTSFGAAPRSPPVPSGPSGALHTSGAWSLLSGSVCRLEARPGPATAHRHRGSSLWRPPHQWGWGADVWLGASSRCPAGPRRRPSISHVIPLRLVQTLNLHRWNCNVFGVCRKMTTINYVRNLGGGGVVAARGRRGQALSTGWPGCLKPLSPLWALAEPQLKPLSPLWARNGRFWCSFRLQWCCWFQRLLFRGAQW